MMWSYLLLLLGVSRASFLQCSISDSLESLDELDESGRAMKQGIICNHWPFYSGGFGKHVPYHPSSSSSSSSDSSSSEDDDLYYNPPSLLPDTITEDSVVWGYQSPVENRKCVIQTGAFCEAWVVHRQEYEKPEHSCHHGHDKSQPPAIMQRYELCLCAETDLTNAYCAVWACLETEDFENEAELYSVTVDNDFVSRSSSSSSSSSSESHSHHGHSHSHSHDGHSHGHGHSHSHSHSHSSSSEDGEPETGNYYRFKKGEVTIELDESFDLSNCWCQQESDNGAFCQNWYCESLEHDDYGCHGKGFSVDDSGWFGCYPQDEDAQQCQQWYGFMMNHHERYEYRCQCLEEDCSESVCGMEEIPLRENYLFHHFWLALLMWSCCCGCCGTKMCFKKRDYKLSSCCCLRWLKCRFCRMLVFFFVIGAFALMHGGVPAFLFFAIFSSLSMWCAYKCEKCKGCCASKCSWKKKCALKKEATNQMELAETNTFVTNKDGENSREDSESRQFDVNKNGHIRVASVDLDEVNDVEIDGETANQ